MDIDHRHGRSARFAPLGARGLARLAEARVAVVGCGGLGSVIAERLARAGVGHLRLADPDRVALSNLPRVALFDTQDARAGVFKAERLAERLRALSDDVRVEAHVAAVGPAEARGFVRGMDLVLDGLDDFGARLVVNDACAAERIPWVYAGVVAGEGCWMAVPARGGPCLRCLLAEAPAPESVPRNATVGVVPSGPTVIAGFVATLALRLLVDDTCPTGGTLSLLDLWRGGLRELAVSRAPACPTCQAGGFPALSAGARGDDRGEGERNC